jgi:hypothetical protein
MRLSALLVLSLLGTTLTACARVQHVTVHNELGESIVVEIATAHPSKLEVSSPLRRHEFVVTVNAGETWKSSQTGKSDRVDLPPHMVNAGLLARFRAWGGEPRTYFVGTREDVVIWVEPAANRRYRVLTVNEDGVPIEVEESKTDWFYLD